MTVRAIPQIGHPVLREPSRALSHDEIGSQEIQRLIDDMIETMHDAAGAGIAANQVGEAVQLCVIGVDHNPRYPYKPPIPLAVLINPVIEPLDGVTFLNNEGCLSVPIRGDLHRFMNIRVRAMDRRGDPFEQVYRGLSAGTVQHEVDHLEGRLIVDRVQDPTTFSTWEMFGEHHRHDYLARIDPVIRATEPKVDET